MTEQWRIVTSNNPMQSIHDAQALEEYRRQWRIEPNHLRLMRNAFYKKQLSAEGTLQKLPEEQRRLFNDQFSFHSLRLHARHDSRRDGASKLVFRTKEGRLIESVILRIATGRTSLCISSQVGCAAHCEFCATGHMGFARNLTSDEILDQVVQANQLLRVEDRSVRNVVLMGMGEPFHNEDEVYRALDILLSPLCFDLSPAHVLVSTVGIPDAMVRCAQRFPRLRMALSLHSARQEQRETIIPLARRFPLDMLRGAMVQVTATQKQPLMIEYLMLRDLNDSDRDLKVLVAFLRGLSVHINLIPYNEIDGEATLASTSPERQRQFAAGLAAAGFPVTIRHSLGADIAAACGQLVRREHARPTLISP